MDILAEKLKMDSLEFGKRNVLRPGERPGLGMSPLDGDPSEMLDKAARAIESAANLDIVGALP
jgi:CO/xanthine dehydrogenase Mo-binding subunit